MAYVEKWAKDKNTLKYRLVGQDLFDTNVDAEGKKTKNSKETFHDFSILDYDYKEESSQKNWFDKGTEFAGECKNLCKAEGIQIYSTTSETKAAFAERTIRTLNNILCRYMEDNGYKYLHKLTKFVKTQNSRSNCSIDLMLNTVKKSDILQTPARIYKTQA